MAYKTILVQAESDPATYPRLEVASALARRFDAALLGVGVELLNGMTLSDPYGMVMADEWITLMREEIDRDMAVSEAQFRRHAEGLNHEWRRVLDPPAPALARLSRLADLIVAGGAPLRTPEGRGPAKPADLAMLSGRPVLVAPPRGGALKARRVVLGWKDSRESRRAMVDALPFLQAAEEVLVLEICESGRANDARSAVDEVARHLERHGVPARGLAKVAPSPRAALELNIEAEAIEADLIVAGAYGHSRVQEFVLGGVTYDLLHAPERFVLLSH